MFITFKKWTAIYVLCLALLGVMFVAMLKMGDSVPASYNAAPTGSRPMLIIDPGHGGEDGGAVGEDGTVEADINLEIALKAAEYAELLGWEVTLTRCEDISIHDEAAQTLRQKKVSDLKNRVSLCEQFDAAVLVSIHQNSMPTAKSVCGAQVFYNPVAGSEELAQAIQEGLNGTINSDHPKSIKSIGDSSYLMKNAPCPSVLVECGFLSNSYECSLLRTQEYQKKLAIVIINSVLHQLESEISPSQIRTDVLQ